jgi:Tetratricopeptide repeat
VEIDQFATHKLSPAESRKLAQQALANEDLFDALVAQGAVEASLQIPAIARPSKQLPWVIGVLAAAAAVILAVFLLRSKTVEPSPAVVAIAKPATLPSLHGEKLGPVLLASELGPSNLATMPAFRGDAVLDRQPQSTGTITALNGDEATVNLGSLDGIAKGTEIGGIVITTVFRDHARGKVAGGASVHVNDHVQVPSVVHLSAILNEVVALAAGPNLDQARILAQTALAAGSSGETRQILEKLAALDYQAGALDAAREHYESAANNFFDAPAASPTEQARTLNSLGALYLLRGDSASATKPLNQAAAITTIDPDLRAQILNNLGVLAEMRGDLTSARDHYQQASAHQNKIAQDNLNRVSSKRP